MIPRRSIAQFLSAFLLLGTGTAASLVLLVCEHCYMRYLVRGGGGSGGGDIAGGPAGDSGDESYLCSVWDQLFYYLRFGKRYSMSKFEDRGEDQRG